MPASFTWQDGPGGGTPMSASNFNKFALVSDIGVAGTPTGDAGRAAFISYAPAPTGGDDLASLTAALTSGVTLLLRPNATYKLSATLPVPAGATLGGTGTLTPLTPASPPTYMLAPSGDGATIRDLTISGTTAYGIHVAGVNDCRIASCSFRQVDGYAVLIEGACARTQVHGNRIRHTTAAKGQGLTAKGLGAGNVPTDTVIANNTVDVRGTVGLEAQEGALRTTFIGNTVSNAQIGITASNAVVVTITGNTAYGCGQHGIEVAGGSDFTVSGNAVDCAGLSNAYGITCDGNPGPVNGTLSDNSVRGVNAADGIAMRLIYPSQTHCQVAVVGNSLATAHHGIVATFCSGLLVVGNMLDGLGTGTSGVALEACTDSLVCNNVAQGFTQAAINAYTGAMTNITIGPNLLSGGTPTQLINGPLGTGSRTV